MTTAGTTWRDTHAAWFGRACSGTTAKGRSGWATVGLTSESRYGGVVVTASRCSCGGSVIRKRSIRRASISAARIRRSSRLADPDRPGRRRRCSATITCSARSPSAIVTPTCSPRRRCAALRGRHTWVGGVAFERESFDPLDVPQFAYFHRVPGLFAQDDIRWTDWLTVSASARLDLHHTYGTFFSPRVSALMRRNGWTSRVSAGTGYFASTPLTEETEAAGLTRLSMPAPLEAETGKSYSIDVTRIGRPRVADRDAVRLVGHSCDRGRARDRRTRSRTPIARDQRRHRAAGDVSEGAVRADRHLYVRAIARAGRRARVEVAADAAAQPRPRRHVGAEGRRPRRRRVLLHRRAAARSESVSNALGGVFDSRIARRAQGRPLQGVPQRREPHRRAPDEVRFAGAARRRRSTAAGPSMRGRRSTAAPSTPG